MDLMIVIKVSTDRPPPKGPPLQVALKMATIGDSITEALRREYGFTPDMLDIEVQEITTKE